ncbi:MAG: Gfo/Idh/MocA family oxidoreductase [Planctomycetes bacterium]|nr:Gfo/Idh/MocA family oxidoreductase [Planctomycetota bacterium]
MKKKQSTYLNRRNFLASGIATGSLLTQSRLLHARSANEQINLGIIGCGSRGGNLQEIFGKIEGVHVAGLCDPDRERLSQAAIRLTHVVDTWTDMRHMLDSPDIDAVVIANPNHWHCLSAIWAMQAGKDAYVEKPLGQTQWEGQQLIKAVKKYGRICQVGTQQRSDPMQARIREFLHEEQALGSLVRVHVHRLGVRKSIGKRDLALQVPNTVDYNLWLGPAADLPLYRDKLQYDWHWMWNTGSGEMGNWGVHIVDDVRGNIFRDEVAFPTSIAATGGRYVWNDAGETPNLQFALLDAGGVPVTIAVCNLPRQENSQAILGPKSGYVAYYENGRYEGQRKRGAAFDVDGKLIRSFDGNGGDGIHQKNFIDALRAGNSNLLNTPVEMGFASTSWCNLANIATRASSPDEDSQVISKVFGEQAHQDALDFMHRVTQAHAVGSASKTPQLGTVLHYDTENDCFSGAQADAGNQLLKRNDRAPFTVPEI